jgi:hypothetical protein
MRTVLLGAVASSWLGLFVHNVADLPGQSVLSSETLYPTLVYLLLVVAWFTIPRRIAARLLAAWALLQLIGGAIISVLPLPFLPFDPEQTLHHYAFHAIYGLLQLPLLVLLAREPAITGDSSRVRRVPGYRWLGTRVGRRRETGGSRQGSARPGR